MLTLYKRGKSRAWWMRLRLISCVDICRSTGLEDREKAELAALDMTAELLRQGPPRKETVIPLKPLIDQYGEWAKMRHTAGTVCRELLALKTFSKYAGGNLSSALNPEEFIKWRLKKVSASCVNVDLRHIRVAFNSMVRLGWINQNPIQGVRLLKSAHRERLALSLKQLRSILDASKSQGQDMEIAAHLGSLPDCVLGKW